MNNFQVAIDATATAMDSAGSAMKENASYMESLEAQTTQLKATFQDFANNVIDKELVSSILTLANNVLGALNTETGKTITQWGLLTGALTGGIVIYGQIAGKLLSAGSAVITLGKALSAGEATATMFTSAALPLAAAIGAIAVAGWKVYEWYKETHQPLSEYTSQIESNNEQLEKNKERLKEINEMSWVDRTPDILAEKEALEKENAELRENIALNEKRSLDQAKRLANQEVTITTGSRYKSSLLGMDWTSEEEAIKDINDIYGEGTWIAGVYIKTLKEVNTTITAQGDALNNYLINELEKYDDILRSNNSLTEEEQIARNNIIQAAKSQVETYQFLDEKVGGLTESQKNLISAYNESIQVEADATDWTEKYGDALIITDEQAQQLIKTFPALKDQLIDTGSGWTILNNNAQTAANGLISADGRIKKSSRDRTKVVLEDLNATITYYGLIAKAFNTMGTASGYTATQAKQANELARSFDATRKQLQAAITRGVYDDTGSGNTPPGNPPSTKKDKDTDLALKEFKNLQKDLEHQRELGLISEEEYYNKLEQLIKDYKAKATAHMKEYKTDVDTINRNMYQYEEEIYKGRAKLAEDLAEKQKKAAEEAAEAQKEALEKQKEALEQQKEDFESAVNYVVKQIDKEIDALQKENNALEDQIKYEELLDNLAKAKQKKLFVFKDGRFQYIQDVDAISSAQKELDAYEREKALDQEIKRLETLKEEWESVTTKYQEEQDKLLAEQILGIDTEKKNWDKRITNLSSFADKYSSILKQITLLQKQAFEDMLLQQEQYLSKLEQRDRDRETLLSGGSLSFTGAGGQEGHIYLDHSSANKPTGYYDSKGNALTKGQVEDYVGTVGGKVYDSSGKSYDANTVKLNKHAEGTTSSPGGLSLVGENGPELRVLNSGDGIIPADATRNLWDWAKFSPKEFNGGTMIHIANLNLPNVRDGNDFVKYMVNNFWRETVQYAST